MITSCERIWHGETWSDGKRGAREYEEVWQLVSDDPNQSPVSVRAYGGLPTVGTPYADDEAAIAGDRNATRHKDSRLIWYVTVTYTYDPAEPNTAENPLAMPPQIRGTAATFLRPIIYDLNGKPVVNSAGCYFDPPPEVLAVRWNITVQWNVPYVPTALLSYAGAVNSSPFTIAGISVVAERGRIVAMDFTEQKLENEVLFHTMTMGLELRASDDEPHDLECLDQGLQQYIPAPGNGLTSCDEYQVDDDGNETRVRASSPQLLNGSGLQIGDPTDPGAAVFLSFNTTRKISFGWIPGVS